jgi:hypothetical protein
MAHLSNLSFQASLMFWSSIIRSLIFSSINKISCKSFCRSYFLLASCSANYLLKSSKSSISFYFNLSNLSSSSLIFYLRILSSASSFWFSIWTYSLNFL